jgi:hypothetical protein
MKRQLLQCKTPQPKALWQLLVSVDATTAKVAVVEGATIETKKVPRDWNCETWCNTRAKITKAKAEGDSFEEEDNIVNAAHNEFYNKA